MPKDDSVYFEHMLDTARKAHTRSQQIDKTRFQADEDVQLALAHLVQILGEAASRVSPQGREAHPEVPWREITGTRNKIVHDYLGVDYDVVWEIVTGDLPPLIGVLQNIVSSGRS